MKTEITEVILKLYQDWTTSVVIENRYFNSEDAMSFREFLNTREVSDMLAVLENNEKYYRERVNELCLEKQSERIKKRNKSKKTQTIKEEGGITLPTDIEIEWESLKEYPIKSTPTMVDINEFGRVKYIDGQKTMRDLISAQLNKRDEI